MSHVEAKSKHLDMLASLAQSLMSNLNFSFFNETDGAQTQPI